MNLFCTNGLINKNLAVHIDVTNEKSWNGNTEFSVISLNQWTNTISSNINLLDWGLTAFDNGRTNEMWSGINFTPDDTLLTLYRIGYNEINNPTPEEFSGISITTNFGEIQDMGDGGGLYFNLNGGYLQGFFKLDGYNYELLPPRYGKGITIETMLYLYEESQGIFYMMGVRAEDKYNPYYSGEFISGDTNSGINTSEDNYLESFEAIEQNKKAIILPEEGKEIIYQEVAQINNLKNNAIAFEITSEKRIKYKYIDENGLLVQNTSESEITNTGFTLISITFTPNNDLLTEKELKCEPQRLGTLIFYVNGRLFWKIKNFPEFYFREIINDKEKQIGVPYSISWGGGSFGLKHSWHYDEQTYNIYYGQTTEYINSNFVIDDDEEYPSDDLILTADNTTFIDDEGLPITVMRIEFTGSTEKHDYLIDFDVPVTTLSNRDYVINASIYNNGFFNNLGENKITIYVYPEEDDGEIFIIDEIIHEGQLNDWIDISTTFRLPENVGKKEVIIGIKIESTVPYNTNAPIFIKYLTYTGADILVQDERKQDLFIEQNFDNSFIGGIQKLRIYDNAFNSTEVLHNAIIESNGNSLFQVNKGGRIIYR
jgi:hypothetical protein